MCDPILMLTEFSPNFQFQTTSSVNLVCSC